MVAIDIDDNGNGETLLYINTSYRGGREIITWCSDWARIPELEAEGLIRYHHLGPNTYGHTDCEYMQPA